MFERYSYGGGVANDSMIQFANDRLPFGGYGTAVWALITDNIL